jgi:hypothetical protein
VILRRVRALLGSDIARGQLRSPWELVGGSLIDRSTC